MGGHGVLRKLRNFGFKTFNPLINESYDDIENIADRLTAIKQEIDRLAELDINSVYSNIMPVLEHNRKVYENLISRG